MNLREAWLIIHFIGLFIGLGSGFALLVLNQVTNKMSPPEKGNFMKTASILAYVGPVGLIILLISGLGLTLPMWDSYKTIGLFHVKLTLFIILFLIVGIGHMLRKRYAGGPPPAFMKYINLLPISLGLVIIILAVLSFH